MTKLKNVSGFYENGAFRTSDSRLAQKGDRLRLKCESKTFKCVSTDGETIQTNPIIVRYFINTPIRETNHHHEKLSLAKPVLFPINKESQKVIFDGRKVWLVGKNESGELTGGVSQIADSSDKHLLESNEKGFVLRFIENEYLNGDIIDNIFYPKN